MHPDELPVTEDMVRGLLVEQFPEWASLPLRPAPAEGTDNRIFRLGDDLAVRLPRRDGDPAAVRAVLDREARAARTVAAATRFPVPRVRAVGDPGAGYRLPWTVQEWLPGTTATEDDPGESAEFARDLAELIHDLRRVDATDWPRRHGRGGDLAEHDEWMQTCFERSEDLLDVAALRALWREYRELPRCGADVLSHRDLIPGNVLVTGGRLTGVLDTSQLAAADPALDLVCAWHLLAAGPRRVLRTGLGCDEVTWERGKAWAFAQAMGLVWYYVDSHPAMSALGRRTLQRLTSAR